MSEKIGNWGKKIDISPDTHITQTNKNARIGQGAHVTDNCKGYGSATRTYIGPDGTIGKIEFGPRGK